MSELSREYGVTSITIGRWVKIFKQNGKDVFDVSSSSSSHIDLLERETANLYKKIGQLTVERDFLKKALDA